MPQFKPGNPGRPLGSKNRFSLVKEMILDALEELGGKEYLVNVGRESPRDFLSLLGRLLPKEIMAEIVPSLDSILRTTAAMERLTVPRRADVQAPGGNGGNGDGETTDPA